MHWKKLKTPNIKSLSYLKSTRVLGILFLAFALFFVTPSLHASIDELKELISERNSQIAEIEREIAKYQQQIQSVNRTANSLQGTIKSLDLSQKKLKTELSLTESKISSAFLQLEKLSMEIDSSEQQIKQNKEVIAHTIRRINEMQDTSTVLVFLSDGDMTKLWAELENLQQFQSAIKQNVVNLRDLQSELINHKSENEHVVGKLTSLQNELTNQKKVVEYNKNEKTTLLAATKNEEAEYKRLLSEMQKRKEASEQELFEFESQLKLFIDPSSIPSARAGLLAWPLDNVYITQMFGRTVDAQRLYVSGTHNGVDLRASVGTAIKSALSGVIEATGDTDRFPGCYSYGKWVMVRHNNGLSTLYAHLSVISVNQGQTVETGHTIGYSGNTGYSTGPHLHFTVYATQGVRVQQYTSSVGCKLATIPIADRKAYIDPMLYLSPR